MWPTNAVPESVVNIIFDRMTTIYGARFADMWRDADVHQLRSTWGRALHGAKPDDIKRGIAALFRTKYPPTLPEFLELCRPAPQRFDTYQSVSDHRTPISPEGEAQLHRIKDLLMRNPAFLKNSPRADGIQWAYQLLDRAERGEAINAMQIAFAEDAIRHWKASHHTADIKASDGLDMPARIASPHIYGEEEISREPGSDDEIAA
ncbi:hypothetical protein CR51_27335 [Caballeronia megalochromosomata]|nr:hypothetical protein CR51_27335 [Caballeronia megalochromosomata]